MPGVLILGLSAHGTNIDTSVDLKPSSGLARIENGETWMCAGEIAFVATTGQVAIPCRSGLVDIAMTAYSELAAPSRAHVAAEEPLRCGYRSMPG